WRQRGYEMSLGSGARGAAMAALVALVAAATAQVAAAHPGRAHGAKAPRHVHHINHGRPDLNLRLAGSPPVVTTGQPATYTATIANGGRRSAGNAAFLDVIPAHATLVSSAASQGSCSGSHAVLCVLGPLAPHATATVTVVVTANQRGPLVD